MRVVNCARCGGEHEVESVGVFVSRPQPGELAIGSHAGGRTFDCVQVRTTIDVFDDVAFAAWIRDDIMPRLRKPDSPIYIEVVGR